MNFPSIDDDDELFPQTTVLVFASLFTKIKAYPTIVDYLKGHVSKTSTWILYSMAPSHRGNTSSAELNKGHCTMIAKRTKTMFIEHFMDFTLL